MVEVTYQMVLSTIQTVSLVVGIFYYLVILRNNQKNQKMTLETRQAQLLSTLSGWMLTNDSLFKSYEKWFNHPNINYEKFKEQYPQGSDELTDTLRLLNFFEVLGVLSRWGLSDSNFVNDMFALLWGKFKPIVRGLQQDYSPGLFENYVWLCESREGLPIKRGFI